MHTMTKKTLAAKLWPRYSPAVELLNRNAHMLATLRRYAHDSVAQFADREGMYGALQERLGNRPITYLEFGVWKGESLRAWTRLNTDPQSRFFGFDSFEGLPEDWQHGFGRETTREHFDLEGRMPRFDDGRVELIKGWFQQTLRPFLERVELRHPLVIHNDCDLHSSTLYVLATLDPYIQDGDLIMFDEYASPRNEYLAWDEYLRAFARQARCVAMSDRWSQTAFEFLPTHKG